ncbi:MAG: hypothetical protein ACPIA2_18865, partial [Mariniblastus sp.]
LMGWSELRFPSGDLTEHEDHASCSRQKVTFSVCLISEISAAFPNALSQVKGEEGCGTKVL